MKNKELLRSVAFSLFLIGLAAMATTAQTTEFTYQGRLNVGGNPASGDYEVQFTLFSVATGGTPIGTRTRVTEAINGSFTVRLDFAPSAFNGFDRWIEVAVRPAGSLNPFVTLLPRQPVTHVPYAFQSINARDADTAGTANNALQLGGVAAAQYVLTTDPRMSDARTPTSGSTHYIHDRTGLIGPQTARFEITGNGYVGGTFHATGAINTVTQYNLAGGRILSIAGTNNLFVGLDTGTNNTDGEQNVFVGRRAGNANTTGIRNAFLGFEAGKSNTSAAGNSFFGALAGQSTVSGNENTFVGVFAGPSNTSGSENTFLGASAGDFSTTGSANVFVGYRAGTANTTGDSNIMIGTFAGSSNSTGGNNIVIGAAANVGSGNLVYATAIGANALVTTSNTIVLGRNDGSDTVVVPGKLQIDTLGTAGATNLCLNGSNRVSPCSSSLRYKSNIAPFAAGLNLVNRLHPISFNWKDGGMKDVGLGAEDVAAIDPLLVTYNKDGQVEGVKYDRIGVVLINAIREQQNAIREQQARIESQQKQVDAQNAEITALKGLVCGRNTRAKVCRSK